MNSSAILAAIICVSCSTAMGYELSDDEYASKVLQQCADQLYDLTMCLRTHRPISSKLSKCDSLLAQTFICMSITPDPEDMESESLFAHAQPEDDLSEEESFVIKRGLGRCIHKCLRGDGKMNFIQCKSMCHK